MHFYFFISTPDPTVNLELVAACGCGGALGFGVEGLRFEDLSYMNSRGWLRRGGGALGFGVEGLRSEDLSYMNSRGWLRRGGGALGCGVEGLRSEDLSYMNSRGWLIVALGFILATSG